MDERPSWRRKLPCAQIPRDVLDSEMAGSHTHRTALTHSKHMRHHLKSECAANCRPLPRRWLNRSALSYQGSPVMRELLPQRGQRGAAKSCDPGHLPPSTPVNNLHSVAQASRRRPMTLEALGLEATHCSGGQAFRHRERYLARLPCSGTPHIVIQELGLCNSKWSDAVDSDR